MESARSKHLFVFRVFRGGVNLPDRLKFGLADFMILVLGSCVLCVGLVLDVGLVT